MEMEKRKRAGNEEEEGRRTRAKDDDEKGDETATEDEVEEFFAIIRRIQDVVRYFEKEKGESSKVGGKSTSKWKPEFQWEDFEEGNGVKVGEKRDEGVEKKKKKKVSLDLNADPESGKITA